MKFNPQSYPPAITELLKTAKRNELGKGTPEPSRRAALAALSPQSLVEPQSLHNREMAMACLAGLWLRHDFLDESHKISQDIDNATGSFWHGIMHRREGDFDNAKYWFRRVHDHPVFAPLNAEARRMAGEAKVVEAASFADQAQWDPDKFVDLCQRAIAGSQSLHNLCMDIQQREWELLFDDCYRRAIDA